jgi:AraC-like DNA-binding protein/predicted transcriptional regulator YdeE
MIILSVGGDQMKNYIQDIIDYVENHIYENLNIDVISRYIGYSKYYLNKVFSIYTGMSIMFYVRKRKLEYATIDLQTKTPIIDIATKYSFNSRKTFTRAFISFYKETPSSYRFNENSLPTKLIISEIGGIKMLPYLSEVKEVSVGQLHVLSHTIVSKNPEDEVIHYMNEYSKEHNLTVLRKLGADAPIDEDKQAKGYRGYECWLVISEEEYASHTPKNVIKKTIDASKYLMLRIENPFSDPFERIPNGWKKLSSIFNDNYQFNYITGGMCFEEVKMVEENEVMDIFIPFK